MGDDAHGATLSTVRGQTGQPSSYGDTTLSIGYNELGVAQLWFYIMLKLCAIAYNNLPLQLEANYYKFRF
jgi:hypothetical protein